MAGQSLPAKTTNMRYCLRGGQGQGAPQWVSRWRKSLNQPQVCQEEREDCEALNRQECREDQQSRGSGLQMCRL